MNRVGEVAPWVPCPNCQTPYAIEPHIFVRYFSGTPSPCPKCSAAIDWWAATTKWIDAWFAFGTSLTLAGARATFVNVDLLPDKMVPVDLTSAGVPADAEIVHLNLTGAGGVFPLVVHGNEVIRDPFPPKFSLRGFPLPVPPQVPAGTANTVNVFAVWFVRKPDDTVTRHLIDAARHYEARRFEGVVVPANIAAEAALTPVVAEALRAYASRDAVKSFLKDAATYSHQLNVLLAMIADLIGVRRLPEDVRVSLNVLRKRRNEVGHEGRCAPQTQAEAAKHLAAAIFGVQYAAFLAGAIKAKQPAEAS
ncbi:MAG: hypothetical protein HYZ28_17840 [Myxococcales bacterium]|nr:hypothetical protein [Myxococcales bacterium]